jgi:hypothetical protein
VFVSPEDIDREALCWLAGLLEGEGSFFAGPPSSPNLPILQVSMVDADVIQRVATLLGVKPFVIRPRRSHWQVAFGVRVRGAPAVAWMTALRPLLGQRRQEQVDLAIASYESRSRQLLDEVAAAEAIRLLGQGLTVREVASRFGTSIWCIYDLRLGRTHRRLDRRALSARGAP